MPTASFHRPAVAFCVVVFVTIGSLTDVANTESSCTVGDRPSCQGPYHRRCECQPNCQYFGTCCADASFPHDSIVGDGGADGRDDSAKPRCCPNDNQFNGSSSSFNGGSATSRLLPEDLYECASTGYGPAPTYIISRCPRNARVQRKLVDLCNGSLKSNHYLDARFWPVSSNVSQLTYQSMYCAFCHGEAAKNVVRWAAQLACVNGTNTSDAEQVLRRCKVRYNPPSGLALPPRCLKNMVGTCELAASTSAAENGSSSVGGRSGAEQAAGGAGASPQQQQPGVAEATIDACRREPQAAVWWGTTPFRNVQCAACSGLAPDQLSCAEPSAPVATGRQVPELSLRMPLDPAGPVCRGCLAADEAATTRCDGTNFVYDWSTRRCQPLCPTGMHLRPDSGCEEPQPPPPLHSTAASGLSSFRPAGTSDGTPPLPPDDNDFTHSTVAVNASMGGSDGKLASAACSRHASPGCIGGGCVIATCLFASLVLATLTQALCR